MNSKDIVKLIEGGESETVEFKGPNVAPDAIARVTSAFLNQQGGHLLIGVGDDGQIVGVKEAETLCQKISNNLNNVISPSALWTVERVAIGAADVVVVDVPAGLDKPYVAAGSIYFRRGSQVVAATRDEISQLITDRVKASLRWERQIAVGVDLNDLDNQLIRETVERALQTQRWEGAIDDSESFLSSFGLSAYGAITNAGLLLFGKQPEKLLPQSRVRLVVMPEGKTGDRYESDRIFEGSLLKIASEIPGALGAHVEVLSDFTNDQWRRQDVSQYPISALREGVMNALVHRDYSLSGLTTISVLRDSLQISNPGGLPEGLTPADLKRPHPSIPRNPDIAYVFYINGLIEILGRGTQRIVEDFRKARIREPQWQSSKLETRLTLFAPQSAVSVEDLSVRQRKIMAALGERKEIRPSDLVTLLSEDVTDRTVRNDLQVLVNRGLVLKLGRGRSTSYALNADGKTSPS
jgi:ATP-dependent DNA helicase RecG